jgi:hypothetical protein
VFGDDLETTLIIPNESEYDEDLRKILGQIAKIGPWGESLEGSRGQVLLLRRPI